MAFTFGIVGGSGMLGAAITKGLLGSGTVQQNRFWLSNRSGSRDGLVDWPEITVTTDNQALADACDAILLCVPPALAEGIGIEAHQKLVLSVMAGVSLERIASLTGATRVVRAMSSPAAAHALAFNPWIAAPAVTRDDKDMVATIFSAIGETAELPSEDQIELFTALTGPVPGFVAFFAECMAGFATTKGVNRNTADRAVRQLFLSAGQMMVTGDATPADHVQAMIDYDGTTAAGLRAMREASIDADIARALDAAVARTRSIG